MVAVDIEGYGDKVDMKAYKSVMEIETDQFPGFVDYSHFHSDINDHVN